MVNNDEPLFRRVPQQHRSRERVERLLDAAAAVFSEVGYDAATTHLVAERAGTAVGTIYQFFPDKRALFAALEERHMARVLEYQARMLVPEIVTMPLEAMCAHLVGMSVAFLSEPVARTMYLLYYTTPRLFERFDETFIRQMVAQAAGLLGRRNPSLADETLDAVSEVFIQTFNHLLLVALREGGERRARLVRELETLLVAYLRSYDRPDSKNLPPGSEGLDERQRAILALVLQDKEVTIKQLDQRFPESRRTLQRALGALVKGGWLEAVGDTNRRSYRRPRAGNSRQLTTD